MQKELKLFKNFENKRSWVSLKDFTDKEREILSEILFKIYEDTEINTEAYNLFIVATSTDKYGIVNRFDLIYFKDNIRLELKNIYCGGGYGSNRIFDAIYNLVSELGFKNAVEVTNYIYYHCAFF